MSDDSDIQRLLLERDRYAKIVSELTERFDEKVEELSLVRQVGDTLGSSLDQRTVCTGTVDLLQVALAPENCSVMLLDNEGALVLAAARGAFDDEAAAYEPAAQPIIFEAGQGVAGAAVSSRMAIRIDDVNEDSRFHSLPDAEVQPASILCVPLLARGRAIGVLNLSDSVPAAFQPKHERILTIISNAVAMALENASLFFEVARSREALATENKTLKRQLSERFAVGGLIGNSPAFRAALQLIEKVADTTANVVITGESGTGKEVFARTLHHNSARADQPFVAINCAALPESLLEAELFGIERGVATGVDARAGTFEKASGGTLFLDEIGDMPAAVQVRLLRVLQERQVQRVGGSEPIDVDVRVVTATHRNLLDEIADGRFREDLYYRLKVVAVELPSLRERREDILPLALHFIGRFAARHDRPDRPLSRSAARAVLEHRWPGNVRELEHCMEQAVLLSTGAEIEPDDLGLDPASASGIRVELPAEAGDFQDVMDSVQMMAERELILRALHECRGNRSQAAKRLGLARRTLLYKLKRYDIS